MKKGVFSSDEAHVVAFRDESKLINLQLHQWKKSGDLIQLKRGLYMFSDYNPRPSEVAAGLYYPCYFSLEYALNFYSLMPEAVFDYTLVTPKATRDFKTPVGRFVYHSIKREAFTGFDTETLMAEPEKALVDYFYLNTSRLKCDRTFWEESRLKWHNLDFKKVLHYAKLYRSNKLVKLLKDFKSHAKFI